MATSYHHVLMMPLSNVRRSTAEVGIRGTLVEMTDYCRIRENYHEDFLQSCYLRAALYVTQAVSHKFGKALVCFIAFFVLVCLLILCFLQRR